MTSRVLGLRVGGTLFGIIAIAQLWRVLSGVEVLVAGSLMPVWPSVVAAIIGLVMCFWLWGLSIDGRRMTPAH